MEALEGLSEHIEELVDSFDSAFVLGSGSVGLTQYIFWMFIVLALVLVVVLVAAKKAAIIPPNKFVGAVEWGYAFVRDSIVGGIIGNNVKRYTPFLATLFFWIFFCNVVGLIPGAKAVTGTISVTWALSICAFCYFNYWGVKAHGGWGYIKSIAPGGLPKVLTPVIWFFEFISLVLRALTLAVRLYANMLAGHLVLGAFALLTSMFVIYAVQSAVYVYMLPSVAWLALLLFMYLLECLVAYIQAYVFTSLTAVYISLATSEH